MVHYPNAPIEEARLDFRVIPNAELNAEDLLKIQEYIGDKYPLIAENHLYSGQVNLAEVGAEVEHKDTRIHRGYTFRASESTSEFSARVDGFGFSVGAPYDRWETFRDEARRLWDAYRALADPLAIDRVSVRYINRIDLPEAEFRVEDYFRTYPQVSSDLPSHGSLNGFFMQLQIWQEDIDSWLIINEAPIPPDGDMSAVQLDIEIFRENFDSPWMADDRSIWLLLEQIRHRKNEVFDASVTRRTKEMLG